MYRTLVLLSLSMLVPFNSAATRAVAAEPVGTLLRSLDAVNFEIVLGRVHAQAARYRHARPNSSKDERATAHETVSFSLRAGIPTLHYDFHDDARRVTLDIASGNEVELAQLDLGDRQVTPVHFHQPRDGQLTLEIETASGPQCYTAPSLWHLMLSHPEVCREHLTPLLHAIRGDWQLEQQLQEIHGSLLQVALDDLALDRQYVQRLIARLRAPEYVDRQLAMRDLRRCGVGVLPLLETFANDQLDSEQRVRLRHVREQLEMTTGDSPDRVATWLSCDQTVWLTLLAAEDTKTSQLAREHLARVFQQPIMFEHVASNADRQRQAERIRNRLLKSP